MFEIERGRRFIEQEQLRLLRQCAGEDHHLALAAGETGEGAVGEVRRRMAASSASMAFCESCAASNRNGVAYGVRPLITISIAGNGNAVVVDCGT